MIIIENSENQRDFLRECPGKLQGYLFVINKINEMNNDSKGFGLQLLDLNKYSRSIFCKNFEDST